MKFAPETMELERFRSYIARTIFDFRSLGVGLHYMKGRREGVVNKNFKSNGVGKSTLWRAMTWCLFGMTTDGLRGPDLRPWKKVEGPTVVALKGIFGKKYHEISRSHSPNLLTLDGKECSQKTLEETLGFGLELFKHTILMGQGEDLFFELEPRKKMRVIAEAVDLDRWERRAEKAAEKLVQRKALEGQVEADLTALEASLAAMEGLLKPAQTQYDNWTADRKEKKLNLEAEIKHFEECSQADRQRLDIALLAEESAGTEAKAMQAELTERLADLASARHFYNKHEVQINTWRHKHDNLKEDLRELGEGSACPACGQSIKGTALEKHKKHLRSVMAALKEDLDVGIPDAVTAKVSLAQKKAHTAQEHLTRFQTKEEDARSVVRRLTPIVTEYKIKIEERKKQLKELDEGANPFGQNLRDLKRRREDFLDDKEELKEELDKVSALVARTQFWVKGFREIQLYIIEELLEHLTMTSNAILEETGLDGWEIEYVIEKETKAGTLKSGLDVYVLSPDNPKPVKWECWSGGEGQRLLIDGALALSEVLLGYIGLETKLEILDEPTQFIVDEGIEELIEFLAERARALGRTIIYTDHNALESAQFTTTIEVTKTKAGSQLAIQP